MTEPTMHTLKTATVVKVYPLKVWVEDAPGWTGDKCVMVQHDAPDSAPSPYCTFHYDHLYTDNANIRRAAENMAKALGASDPVEFKQVPELALDSIATANRASADAALLEAVKTWFLSGDADGIQSEPTRALRRAAARWMEST